MKITFKEADKEEAKKELGKNYADHVVNFNIQIDDDTIGILGVEDAGFVTLKPFGDTCWIHYYVKPEYRLYQTVGLVKAILNFPGTLGFKELYIFAFKSKIIRVLERFKRYGVEYLGKNLNYHYFKKQLVG